jgi:L-alanine-DL-glutamate epimerase-like enolase superfamily enzyme
MRLSSIDVFYLAIPNVTNAADGTQDSLVVRIRDEDGLEGWGECDASPLVTLAAYCCPPSHGNIINLRDTLLGERVESAADVVRLGEKVLRDGLDIEQVHHALSGADIALWDLLGKKLGEPVWRLLESVEPSASPPAGVRVAAHAKVPYASVLFADSPEATKARAAKLRGAGYAAAKFGWGPLGRHGEAMDIALVEAARSGLGPDARLFVDAGVVWGEDDATAFRRAEAFQAFKIGWLEEPLLPDAVAAYGRLRRRNPPVPIAAGEGANRLRFAEDLVENGGVDYLQIDAGRIGGVTTAFRARRLAERRGVVYVNHTFKSHLSLAAALHVFATAPTFDLLEYPAEGSELSRSLVRRPLERGADGLVRVPEAPGLGVEVDLETVRRFLQPVRIEVAGRLVHDTRAP